MGLVSHITQCNNLDNRQNGVVIIQANYDRNEYLYCLLLSALHAAVCVLVFVLT